jgi:hypothetical protein
MVRREMLWEKERERREKRNLRRRASERVDNGPIQSLLTI